MTSLDESGHTIVYTVGADIIRQCSVRTSIRADDIRPYAIFEDVLSLLSKADMHNKK